MANLIQLPLVLFCLLIASPLYNKALSQNGASSSDGFFSKGNSSNNSKGFFNGKREKSYKKPYQARDLNIPKTTGRRTAPPKGSVVSKNKFSNSLRGIPIPNKKVVKSNRYNIKSQNQGRRKTPKSLNTRKNNFTNVPRNSLRGPSGKTTSKVSSRYTRNPHREKKIETSMWGYQLALARYRVEKTHENLESLVSNLISVVENVCLYSAKYGTSISISDTSDPRCLSQSDDLKKYVPNAPVLVCLKKGFKSTECSEAYNSLKSEKYNKGKSKSPFSKRSVPKDDKFSAIDNGREEEYRKLASKLRKYVIEYKKTLVEIKKQKNDSEPFNSKSKKLKKLDYSKLSDDLKSKASENNFDENLPQKRDRLKKYIGIMQDSIISYKCDFNKYKLIPIKSEKIAIDDDKTVDSKDVFSNLGSMKRLSNIKKTSEQQYSIIRLISSACKKSIDSVLAFNSDHSLATCAQWGEYSPICIGSTQKLKLKKGIKTKSYKSYNNSRKRKPNKSNDTLVEF